MDMLMRTTMTTCGRISNIWRACMGIRQPWAVFSRWITETPRDAMHISAGNMAPIVVQKARFAALVGFRPRRPAALCCSSLQRCPVQREMRRTLARAMSVCAHMYRLDFPSPPGSHCLAIVASQMSISWVAAKPCWERPSPPFAFPILQQPKSRWWARCLN